MAEYESIRLLLVEGDRDFAGMATELLQRESEDFVVEAVATAEEALSRIETTGVDCIVSDYALERQTGIEFLETVREDLPDLPFILLTGKGNEAVASRAISAGVTNYLRKGGTPDQFALLANRIENAVARNRSRQERQRAERQFEAVFNDPDMFIAVVGPDGTVRRINETAMEYVAVDRESVIGEPFWETPWWDDVDRSNAEDLTKEVASGEYIPFAVEGQAADGSPFVLEGTARPVTNKDGEVVSLVASGHDVTDERERKRELQRFERMLNTMLSAACIYDETGDFAVVNKYLAEFYGTTRENLEGRSSNLIPKIQDQHEGDPYEELLAGDREEISGEVEGDFPGHGYEALRYRLTPFRVNGEIEGALGVTHEITELKERERVLEQQNERLEEFASIVAHDLRNPLNVAAGRLELARRDCDSEHLTDVSHALDSIETLIEDLLDLAREGRPVEELRPVALQPLLEECWRAVSTPESELIVEIDQTIMADRNRLKQLVSNLLRNAIEHNQETNDEEAGHGDENGVTITIGEINDSGFFVADDGRGIPEDIREKVFEVGYSTSDDGTGFGLNIAEEIAEAHGWDIDLTESDEGGARFDITGVEIA